MAFNIFILEYNFACLLMYLNKIKTAEPIGKIFLCPTGLMADHKFYSFESSLIKQESFHFYYFKMYEKEISKDYYFLLLVYRLIKETVTKYI